MNVEENLSNGRFGEWKLKIEVNFGFKLFWVTCIMACDNVGKSNSLL